MKMNKCLLFLGLCASLTALLGGCALSNNPQADTASPAPGVSSDQAIEESKTIVDTSKLISVSADCSHMRYPNCYHFRVWQDAGKTLFTADCQNPNVTEEDKANGKWRIQIENRAVPEGELDKINEILNRHNMAKYLNRYFHIPKLFHVCDATTYSFSAHWQGSESKTARTKVPCLEDLKNYLVDMAVRYQ